MMEESSDGVSDGERGGGLDGPGVEGGDCIVSSDDEDEKTNATRHRGTRDHVYNT
jgi:hypothetical protein